MRRPGDLISLNIACAGHTLQDGLQILRAFQKHIGIWSEDLDGKLGFSSRQEFIDGHGDRLADIDPNTWKVLQVFGYRRSQIIRCETSAPLRSRFQRDKGLDAVDGIGMGADFAATDAADNRADFREALQKTALQPCRGLPTFCQRYGRRHRNAQEDIPLFKRWRELRAEPRTRKAANQKQTERERHSGKSHADEERRQRLDQLCDPAVA